MRSLTYAAAVVLAAAGPALAAPNDIIWDPPQAPADTASKETPKQPAPAGQPDKNGIVWNAPPRKPASAVPAFTPPAAPRDRLAQAPGASGPCREFQTTIVIEGRRQPAHGTVCQQPDGSWRVVDK